jgi:hypothetical protein
MICVVFYDTSTYQREKCQFAADGKGEPLKFGIVQRVNILLFQIVPS